jgi:16S rRNA processing protein RimM
MGKSAILPVGEIVGAHGVKGNTKIYSYAEAGSTVFTPGKQVLVRGPGGAERSRVIESVQPHGRFLLVSFAGIGSREAAESMIGSTVLVDGAQLPELDEGEYYWFELVGLSVLDREGTYLGEIESIIPTGSNDVYVVRNGTREILVPALADVVREIDLTGRIMRVKLPEGLSPDLPRDRKGQ